MKTKKIENSEETITKFNNKKKIILGSIIGVLIGSLISVSYAFYTYTNTGNNSQLVAGDIYMKYGESNQLELSNAMPSSTYDSNKYFQFTITGKNTYSKPIIYDISITHGDNHATRTRRIEDRFLKFTLIREETGKEPVTVVNAKSYSDFSNGTRIAVETIQAEQNTEITYTYKLYMWIDNNVVIGNVNQDYTQTQWNEIFASVKVNVTGDFQAKELAKPIEEIFEDATVDTSIKFYQVSSNSNGKGLYVRYGTEKSAHPIYYYRGDVNNNNVKFAGYCWKIVRTTETGGTKMIFSGSPNPETGYCDRTNADTFLQNSTFKSSPYNSPAYVGYSYGTVYPTSSVSIKSDAIFASSVKTDGTLNIDSGNTTIDPSRHYTYNSPEETAIGIATSGDDANNVYYCYYNSGSTYYCIKIPKNKSIETAMNEMLHDNSNTKEHPSTIQTAINDWWGTGGDNSLDAKYGKYLEDTDWCDDRSTYSIGGFDPNNGAISGSWNDYGIVFKVRARYDTSTFSSNPDRINLEDNKPVLTCSNLNDNLKVSNGKLTYPIALLTYDEVNLAGAIWNSSPSSYYLKTSGYYWLLSPSYFFYRSNALVGRAASGRLYSVDVFDSSGVRPALSLKPGTEILRGKGTPDEPYIVTE